MPQKRVTIVAQKHLSLDCYGILHGEALEAYSWRVRGGKSGRGQGAAGRGGGLCFGLGVKYADFLRRSCALGHMFVPSSAKGALVRQSWVRPTIEDFGVALQRLRVGSTKVYGLIRLSGA